MVIGGPGHPQTEVVGQGPGSLAIGGVVVAVGGPAATRARTRSAVASSIRGRVIETASTSPV